MTGQRLVTLVGAALALAIFPLNAEAQQHRTVFVPMGGMLLSERDPEYPVSPAVSLALVVQRDATYMGATATVAGELDSFVGGRAGASFDVLGEPGLFAFGGWAWMLGARDAGGGAYYGIGLSFVPVGQLTLETRAMIDTRFDNDSERRALALFVGYRLRSGL